MGQYYEVLLKAQNHRGMQRYSPDNYENEFVGDKLMEHSWLHNGYVNAICEILKHEPCQISWVGDYAELEGWTNEDGNPLIANAANKEYYLGWVPTMDEFWSTKRRRLDMKELRNFWKIHYEHRYPPEKWENAYSNGEYIGTDTEKFYKENNVENYFLVNDTLGEFLDMGKYIARCSGKDQNEVLWCIHPLPLLTCTCNHSGGSYYGDDPTNDVGRWNWCVVHFEKDKPKGLKEISPTWIEE